jgi:hypothetical protein
MNLGPAGYGRYDDAGGQYVGCPRARSSRSRCLARAGRLALDSRADEPRCRHCAHDLHDLVEELAREYPRAAGLPVLDAPEVLADEFALMVREATEPRREA